MIRIKLASAISHRRTGRKLLAAYAVLRGRPVIYGAKIRGTIELQRGAGAVISDNEFTRYHGSVTLGLDACSHSRILSNAFLGSADSTDSGATSDLWLDFGADLLPTPPYEPCQTAKGWGECVLANGHETWESGIVGAQPFTAHVDRRGQSWGVSTNGGS